MQHSEHYNRILSEAQKENDLKQESDNSSSNGILTPDRAKLDDGVKLTSDTTYDISGDHISNQVKPLSDANVEKT